MRSPGRTPNITPLEAVSSAGPRAHEDPQARSLALKHALDRAGAVMALVAAAPLLLLAALVARLHGDGPVIVRERRIARDGRSFEMLAFAPLPLLRRWSIDQLPQLVNVLKGEMSFVGPRPERPEFVEIFGANLRRHDGPRRVRPGITGWSQVRGLEAAAPLAERLRWDDWYVQNWSLRLDAKILLRTMLAVARADELD